MNLIKSPSEIKLLPVQFEQVSEVILRNPTAIAERDALLAQSANIERVAGESSQRAAVEMLGKVSAMMSACDKHRAAVKAPFIKIGKLIESIASSFVEGKVALPDSPGLMVSLETEKARLQKALEEYQRKLDREAAEERQRQEAERKRLEDEKRRLEEEVAQKQRELEQAALKANSDAEAQRIAQQAATLAQEQQIKQSQLALQQASLVKVEEVKPQGLSVRRPWRFEVTDMAALYKARPDLCNAPTPKTAEINRLIAGDNGLRELPGIRVFQDLDVTAK